MKKSTIVVTIFLLAVVAGGTAAIRLARAPRIHADGGCSLESTHGSYGFAHTGYYFGPQGVGLFSAAGVVTADGNGNMTATDTAVQDGVVTRHRTYTGVYQINPNCTGSITFKNGDQLMGNMDFVVTNNGKSLKFIQTDQGTAITGTAELQFPGN